jgi:hypothetical protein
VIDGDMEQLRAIFLFVCFFIAVEALILSAFQTWSGKIASATRDGVLRMIQRAGIAAGLGDRIHLAAQRHGRGGGASVTTLKALGGHRSLTSLAGYVATSGAPLWTLRWKAAR